MSKYLIMVFGLVLISACHPTSKIYIKDPSQNGPVIFSISKSPCFGACPVYDATLYQNGLLIYNGKRFSIKVGCFYARVSKKDMAKLKSWFDDAGFFNMKDKYPEQDVAPVDLPSCEIFFSDGTNSKKISDKNWKTPKSLTDLEAKVETWINIQNLQSCDK